MYDPTHRPSAWPRPPACLSVVDGKPVLADAYDIADISGRCDRYFYDDDTRVEFTYKGGIGTLYRWGPVVGEIDVGKSHVDLWRWDPRPRKFVCKTVSLRSVFWTGSGRWDTPAGLFEDDEFGRRATKEQEQAFLVSAVARAIGDLARRPAKKGDV